MLLLKTHTVLNKSLWIGLLTIQFRIASSRIKERIIQMLVFSKISIRIGLILGADVYRYYTEEGIIIRCLRKTVVSLSPEIYLN